MDRKELVRWIDNIQTNIGKVFLTEGISAKVLRIIQSPMVVSFYIELEGANKGQIDKVMQLGITLEQYVHESPIRVYPVAGHFVIEIPSPYPVTPHASQFIEHTTIDTLCLGVNTEVKFVTLSLKRYPSIMFIAPPRAGKTSAVRSLIYSLIASCNQSAENVNFILCAEKLEYWRAFIDKRGVVSVISDFTEMRDMIARVSRQLSQKVSVGDSFNPPLFIVIDDLLRVLKNTEGLDNLLAEIASTGGSAQVYLILITQAAGLREGTGGIKVEDNIAARIIYRTSSKAAAARSTGEDASGISDLTNRQGDALFVCGNVKTRITTGYVSDEDIQKLPDILPGFSRFLRNLVSLPRPDDDKVKKVTLQQSIVDQPKETFSLKLPVIKPARELTPEESSQVRSVVKHYKQIGTPLSNNRLMNDIFGGKNGKYKTYLDNALKEP